MFSLSFIDKMLINKKRKNDYLIVGREPSHAWGLMESISFGVISYFWKSIDKVWDQDTFQSSVSWCLADKKVTAQCIYTYFLAG